MPDSVRHDADTHNAVPKWAGQGDELREPHTLAWCWSGESHDQDRAPYANVCGSGPKTSLVKASRKSKR